tara:strand:+ start:52 stop:348 length:297 start_codon:yes stop_codon:yes gene_type:complete
MANDIFNYCVATNTGKGFITHDDSRRFWISGQPGNVWVCTDCVESRHWIARNNGTSKTKSEAQALVNTEVTNAQNTWDALSDEEKARSSGRPGAITLP